MTIPLNICKAWPANQYPLSVNQSDYENFMNAFVPAENSDQALSDLLAGIYNISSVLLLSCFPENSASSSELQQICDSTYLAIQSLLISGGCLF